MNVKYIKFNGKHPADPKENRHYYDTVQPEWYDYGCSYSNEFLKVDIDDYDHNTSELDEPINGKPRSEAIIRLLDDLNIRYNGIKTDNGVHLFFRMSNDLEKKNMTRYCMIGVKAEYKFPDSDDHIPLRIKRKERIFFKGSINNTDIDELPYFLLPLQQRKTEKSIDLSFPEGNRTQPLCSYLFLLVKRKGFSQEQAFNIIRYMNEYVFENPISSDILKSEILNESTVEKLKQAENERESKNLSHIKIGDEIIEKYHLIYNNGVFYAYENGVYKPFSDDKIRRYICENYPAAKINLKKEIIDYMRGIAFQEAETADIINIKNGILSINENGSVQLLPHSERIISFKQFNAVYNPEAKCELLIESLNKWFSNDKEQFDLFKQLLGYLLMNHVDYHKIFFFIGKPSTGKSCALNLIILFCGKENISTVSLTDLNGNFSLENIVNKTANIFGDISNKKILESETFKSLADGSGIDIKRKYKTAITNYQFTGKMIFGMNQFPDMSSDFEGVTRRIAIFNFEHLFKKDDNDFNPHIVSDLSTPECMSVMLNMAIEGYISLIVNKGFISTKENDKAIKEFTMQNDNILQWIDVCEITEDYLLHEPIKFDHGGSYINYKEFCFGIGEDPKTQAAFSTYMKNKYNFGIKRTRISGIKGKDNRTQMFFKK